MAVGPSQPFLHAAAQLRFLFSPKTSATLSSNRLMFALPRYLGRAIFLYIELYAGLVKFSEQVGQIA